MIRPPRKNAGASIADQGRRKLKDGGNVVALPKSRIERGIHRETGQPTLSAVFTRDKREPHVCNLGFLLKFPKLTTMFSEGFAAWGVSNQPNTRVTVAGELNRGFFSFISDTYGNDLGPEDIDDEVLIAFRENLNTVGEDRRKALSTASVRKLLAVVRIVLSAVEKGPYANMAQRIAERVPAGPIGAAQDAIPTEVLSLEELLEIMTAAEREVLVVGKRFDACPLLLEDGRQKLADPSRVLRGTRADFLELSVALAALDGLYPGVIGSLPEIVKENPQLAYAVKFWGSKKAGKVKLQGHFYPSARDLVPFAVLIAISTVFNSDTVLGLNWVGVDMTAEQVGIPAIEFIGEKGRAARNPVRLLDPEANAGADLSLGQLLRLLMRITTRIRKLTDAEYKDKLFIFVQLSRAKKPRSWGCDGTTIQSSSADTSWKWALKGFIKDNSLRSFNIGQLRPTILNLVQSLDGSLEAASTVGNHRNPRTTWTHYTSDGVRKQYRERIGKILLLRERWFDSDGVIDPRFRMAGSDKGAATPGFLCLDPFESPRPNQYRARLCDDYGGCPSCPLAGAQLYDPTSVAYYTALELVLYKSQLNMSPTTWVDRWAPVLSDLKALLALVPSAVLDESRKLVFKLPMVG